MYIILKSIFTQSLISSSSSILSPWVGARSPLNENVQINSPSFKEPDRVPSQAKADTDSYSLPLASKIFRVNFSHYCGKLWCDFVVLPTVFKTIEGINHIFLYYHPFIYHVNTVVCRDAPICIGFSSGTYLLVWTCGPFDAALPA